MPRRIILDCCALVHAKAMQRLTSPPLALLHTLAQTHHYTYLTSKKVYGELGQSTLSTMLDALPPDCLALETARRQEVKQLKPPRGLKEPGDNDKELIALAQRHKLPLLTHDGAAAALARHVGVEVLDLVDLAMHACWEGAADVQALHDAWGDLKDKSLPWPWPDYPWRGDLISTFRHRYA